MKQELQDSLLEYLGELRYDYENVSEYFKKGIILNKIKAIHTLLELEYVGYIPKTFTAKSKRDVDITDQGVNTTVDKIDFS